MDDNDSQGCEIALKNKKKQAKQNIMTNMTINIIICTKQRHFSLPMYCNLDVMGKVWYILFRHALGKILMRKATYSI